VAAKFKDTRLYSSTLVLVGHVHVKEEHDSAVGSSHLHASVRQPPPITAEVSQMEGFGMLLTKKAGIQWTQREDVS